MNSTFDQNRWVFFLANVDHLQRAFFIALAVRLYHSFWQRLEPVLNFFERVIDSEIKVLSGWPKGLASGAGEAGKAGVVNQALDVGIFFGRNIVLVEKLVEFGGWRSIDGEKDGICIVNRSNFTWIVWIRVSTSSKIKKKEMLSSWNRKNRTKPIYRSAFSDYQ